VGIRTRRFKTCGWLNRHSNAIPPPHFLPVTAHVRYRTLMNIHPLRLKRAFRIVKADGQVFAQVRDDELSAW